MKTWTGGFEQRNCIVGVLLVCLYRLALAVVLRMSASAKSRSRAVQEARGEAHGVEPGDDSGGGM